VGAMAAAGWFWPEHRPMPRVLAIPAFAIAGNAAALVALVQAIGGRQDAVWEPTRRGKSNPTAGAGAEHG
jgi:hypothetical protein